MLEHGIISEALFDLDHASGSGEDAEEGISQFLQRRMFDGFLVDDNFAQATSYTWDQYGNCKTMTTPRGTTTTYTLSYANFPLGELTQVQQGSKTATSLTYFEPSGLIHTITAPKPGTSSSGQTVVTSFTWDSLGNVLTIVSPGNNATTAMTTTFNYTTDGAYSQSAAIRQPLTLTDNLGHVTHLRWDMQGRRISQVDAIGIETDTVYNLAGQTYQGILPATGQTGAGHGYIQKNYQYAGGPLQQTVVYDESNVAVRQVTTTYGPEGETLSVTGSTEPVALSYDPMYRVKTVTDGNNHSTSYGWSQAGFLSSVVYPGGDAYQYPSYDNSGNLLQRVDGRGVVTNYLYTDIESRLTDVQYPSLPALNVHLHYDAYGRSDSVMDGTGSRSVTFDDTGKPLTLTTTYTGLPAQGISYSYFPDGTLQTLGTPAGNFSHSFDAVQRPAGLTNPFGETFAWTYLDNDQVSSQRSGNAVVANYTLNALGQLTDLANRKLDATLLSEFSGMSHDGAGNRVAQTTNLPASPTYSGTTGYQYDVKDQLTQESSTRIGGFTNNFGFDTAGNSTNFKGQARTFNANNQDAANGYDLNGNPTTYNAASCAYDPENRMTSYGNVMTAGYMASGLRAWKQTNTGRTYYLYAGGTVPVCELDASGTVVAVNTVERGALLSRHTSLGSVFYAFDPQGSASHRLDSTGATLSTSTFDAFGVRATNDTSGDPFAGFGGQHGYRNDPETGLQLLGRRYYDAVHGRFVTRDAIGSNGGVNLYCYTMNGPLVNSDPEGTQTGAIAIEAVGVGEGISGQELLILTGEGTIIATGIEAIGELVEYSPGHPSGPLTQLGENIGDWVGDTLWPTTDDPPVQLSQRPKCKKPLPFPKPTEPPPPPRPAWKLPKIPTEKFMSFGRCMLDCLGDGSGGMPPGEQWAACFAYCAAKVAREK